MMHADEPHALPFSLRLLGVRGAEEAAGWLRHSRRPRLGDHRRVLGCRLYNCLLSKR